MRKRISSLRTAKALDRRAIYKFGIPRILLMENAGRKLAEFVISKTDLTQKVAVLAGPGYNGGDGFVTARHLYLSGRNLALFMLGSRERAKGDTILQLRILENMGIKVTEIRTESELEKVKKKLAEADIIVDALFGIGLRHNVKGVAYALIKYLNSLAIKKVAVDIPSGLHPEKGYPQGIAVKANYTVTFQVLKKGLLTFEGKKYAGKIIQTDIGG